MPASAAWLLLVLYHASPRTNAMSQLGPFATRAACEHSRAIIQHTAASADPSQGTLDGVCVSVGTTDAP